MAKKPTGKKSPAKKAVKKVVAKKPVTKRKTVDISPVIETAIKSFVVSKKPFKIEHITEHVMKGNPKLNRDSVKTGAYKLMSNKFKGLAFELKKDGVGRRPYKVYKP